MKKVSIVTVFFGTFLFLAYAVAQQGAPKSEQQPVSVPESVQQRVIEVWGKQQEKLFENPDVLGVLPSPATGEIIIETDRPDMVPSEIEGIKIKKHNPNKLPPPPGVIVLQRGGIVERRTDLDVCPEGFEEHLRYRWRFCQPSGDPQPFPLGELMSPPIAGIPYMEARAILQRHHEFFKNLPGVRSFGLRKEGIGVETTQPELLPKEVEGLPVLPEPVFPVTGAGHTISAPAIRPVHGGIGIDDTAWPCDPNTHLPVAFGGTLGGVVLADGKPWGVTNAHVLYTCESAPTCQPCDLPDWCPPNAVPYLKQCAHYQGPTIAQPSVPCPASSSATVGRASRYARVVGQTTTADVAAFFLDNDTTEGNGSLVVDRKLHVYSDTGAQFKGTLATSPTVDDGVLIVGAFDHAGQHLVYATVYNTGTFITIDHASTSCWYGLYVYGEDQLEYRTITPLIGGNSGALVLNATGDILSIHRWSGPISGGYRGGGTKVSKAQAVLGYNAWYGTQTVTDNTLGVFRPNTVTWYVDNGNGKYDGGTSVPPTTIPLRDQCFAFARSTDVPLTGDWDNAALHSPSNDFTVGVYRPIREPTAFYLSNTNPLGTVMTMEAGPSSFGYRPVTGKWQGNNGASNATSKVGVFRPSTGGWYLDSGNLMAEGCGADYCFFLAAGMYQAGDTAIAGDWNGDGIVSIGLFHPGGQNGTDYFYLSNLNPKTIPTNSTISGWNLAIQAGPGSFGYVPVVGDWTGTGGGKVGVVLPSAGWWYLDNGNFSFGVWDGGRQASGVWQVARESELRRRVSNRVRSAPY